ncbi:MAG: hypothetical protein SGPRY_014016, partial [Prymnesium sp.]
LRGCRQQQEASHRASPAPLPSSNSQAPRSHKVGRPLSPRLLVLPGCFFPSEWLSDIASCHADAIGSISNWWSNSAPVDQHTAPDEDHAEDDEVIGEESQEAFELATMATAVRELRDAPRTFLRGALDPQRRWLALTGAAAPDTAISMLF